MGNYIDYLGNSLYEAVGVLGTSLGKGCFVHPAANKEIDKPNKITTRYVLIL